ncbi:MBL fold metallo-hydrolase [Modestobacter sp. NPDC049651]|uniref:MBL fold metallo-hydrolase n=1 Tax=unclassified Modestobacter TaxID=2643866 RepID=UPI0033D18292
MPGPSLSFLGHSTVRVELGGRTVLSDPLLTGGLGPLRRVVPTPPAAAWAGVDLVLVSHLHGDHLHLPSLRLLGPDVPVVVPRGAGRWLTGKGLPDVTELAPGETVTVGGLTVTGVPAVHSGHRWGPRSTSGPDARAMGHLLRAEGCTVYLAGDTDLFPGMAALGDDGIDVAALPVWGWGLSLGPGHLDPARAAEAVRLLRPRIAVPVHWGTLAPAGLTTLPNPWRARMRGRLTLPPREFATAVAAGGSATTVAVTRPGSAVDLSPLTGSAR